MAVTRITRMITPSTRLLSRREVARIFKVTPSSIGRWERAGLIQAIKLNARVIRYRQDEISRLLNRSIPNQETTKAEANK